MFPYDFPSASALRGEQGALPVRGRGCRCVPPPLRVHHVSQFMGTFWLQRYSSGSFLDKTYTFDLYIFEMYFKP